MLLTISLTGQAVRFFTSIVFCMSWYPRRNSGATIYDLLRAVGSASCDIAHETRGTFCSGHWVLHLVISLKHETGGTVCFRAFCSASCDLAYETAGVRFVTGIGLCALWYHSRNRAYDVLRALGLHLVKSHTRQGVRYFLLVLSSASCEITHETRGTICCRRWVLHLVNITHETGGTICYGHWVLRLVKSHTRHGVRFVAGVGSCIWWISHTRQGVRFVTGTGFCVLWNRTRDTGYDLLRALVLAFCDIAYERAEVTIFYGHWVLHLEITRGRGYDCYGHWILHLVISFTGPWVRFVRGIVFCTLWYHTRDRGYDFLRALCSASREITHETGGTICYGHSALHLVLSHTIQGYDLLRALCSASCDITHETRGYDSLRALGLHLVISHTRHGVRFLTGIVFCILRYHSRDRGTISYGYCVLNLVTSPTKHSWRITHETGGTICYGHWVLHLVK